MKETRTIRLPFDDLYRRLTKPLQARALGTVPLKRFRTFKFESCTIDCIRIRQIRVGQNDLKKRVSTVYRKGEPEFIRETTFHDRNGLPLHEYR